MPSGAPFSWPTRFDCSSKRYFSGVMHAQILTPLIPPSVCGLTNSDPQDAFLRVTSSQLTSHGAMLFAAVVGTMGFLQVVEAQARYKTPVSLVVSTLGLLTLVTFTIYGMLRLLYYGQLVAVATEHPPSFLLGDTLETYTNLIVSKLEKQSYKSEFTELICVKMVSLVLAENFGRGLLAIVPLSVCITSLLMWAFGGLVACVP